MDNYLKLLASGDIWIPGDCYNTLRENRLHAIQRHGMKRQIELQLLERSQRKPKEVYRKRFFWE